MLMPLERLRSILELLFREGVLVGERDGCPRRTHPQLPGVANVEVRRAMASLRSRGLVRQTAAWRHLYWYLTDAGVAHLRQYLRLPPDVVPRSLQRVPRPAAPRPEPRRAAAAPRARAPPPRSPRAVSQPRGRGQPPPVQVSSLEAPSSGPASAVTHRPAGGRPGRARGAAAPWVRVLRGQHPRPAGTGGVPPSSVLGGGHTSP
uniref:Plectin/eS10 N-terminal domain-containing protein n=1 Tax=Cyanoderma ruficeps TaxID=181631 RepID=A0A8C3QVS9_9PASS